MKHLSEIRLDPAERKAIRAFTRRLKKALGKRLISVLLFGSKARGDDKKNSDIDIYVLVRRDSQLVDKRIARVTGDILNDYDILISPVSYDLREERINVRMGSFFFEAVKTEGIPL